MSDLKFCIDEFTVTAGSVDVSGWVISSAAVQEVAIVVPGPAGFVHGLASYGLPSEDVAAHHGAHAGRARFSERMAIPAGLPIRDLFGCAFEVVAGEGAGEGARVPLFSGAYRDDVPAGLTLGNMKVGIGVTTFNRCGILKQTLRQIRLHTTLPHTLVVADDGSSDETRAYLRMIGVPTIEGENRGVAWNKNRCLFYLHQVARCDVVILLEDDTYPDRNGWELELVLAALAHGHVNWMPPWVSCHVIGGLGKWHDPARLLNNVSNQCSGFSAAALSWVGYMDSRFGSYGYEHVDHTQRMLRAGFGGITRGLAEGNSHYFALTTGLRCAESVSHGSAAKIEENARVYEAVRGDQVFRPPWRSDAEFDLFRRELKIEAGVAGVPDPSGAILQTEHGTYLYLDRADGSIQHSARGDLDSHITLTAEGALSLEAGGAIEGDAAVAWVGEGVVAIERAGTYLRCDPASPGLGFGSQRPDVWEIFTLEARGGREAGAGPEITVAGQFGGTWSIAAANRRLAEVLDRYRPGACGIADISGEEKPIPAQTARALRRMRRGVRPPMGEQVVIHQGWPVIAPVLRGRHTLSYFFWEESRVPAEMVAILNGYDAVLTSAETVKEALLASGLAVPAFHVGYSPDLKVFEASPWGNRVRRDDGRPFTFLHVSAGDARKGIDLLIAAYAACFGASEPVRLLIKSAREAVEPHIATLRARHPELPPIEIIDGELTMPELAALYARADVMVLPTRGEGFCVPAAEAIAARMRLIVTGAGGHMQFCSGEVARLLRYRVAPSPIFGNGEVSCWVEPEFEDLCAALREAREQPWRCDEAARQRALAAIDAQSWAGRIFAAVSALEGAAGVRPGG